MEPAPPRDAITRDAPHQGATETGVRPGLPPAAVGNGEPDIRRSGREAMLSFMLMALLGGMVFFFLNFVSFGVFFYVLAAVAGIMAVGFFHYVLWGYGLSEKYAEEMARERALQQKEMEEHI